MISSYLLHTGYSENTKDALRFYGDARTLNNKVYSNDFPVVVISLYLSIDIERIYLKVLATCVFTHVLP